MELFCTIKAFKKTAALSRIALLLIISSGMGSVGWGKSQVKPKESFLVLRLENRSKVQGLDWLEAGGAMVVADKLSTFGRLYPSLEGATLLNSQENLMSMNTIGKKAKAKWLVTGWFARPDWKMELGLQFWKMEGNRVKLADEYVSNGDFSQFDEFVTRSLKAWAKKRKVVSPQDNVALLEKPASKDFYAFTLFGRGVSELAELENNADENNEEAKSESRIVKNIEKAVFIDPTITIGHRLLATAYEKQGEFKKAQFAIDRFVSERPNDDNALLVAANLAESTKNNSRASELLQAYVIKQPDDLARRHRLARIHWDLGEVDKAFAQLKIVKDSDPSNRAARRTLITIYGLRGDYENLVLELEQLLKLEPKSIELKSELSTAYRYIGQENKSLKMYNSILKMDPNHSQTLKNLGDYYSKNGATKKARKFYKKSLQANPDDPRPYFLLGALHTKQGDDAAAKTIYQEAKKFDGFLPEVYNNLGAIEYRQGRIEQSLLYLKKAIKERPKQVRFLYNYSLSLSALGRLEESLKQAELGLELSPQHKGLNYQLGVVRLKQGQLDEAGEAFRKTLEIDPDHKGANHNLALINVHLSRLKNGVIKKNDN